MREFLLGASITCALVFSAISLAEDWQFEDVERIVAISDIHGAYGAMRSTLENAGVIDAEGTWAGENTHLVISGDILDRGPGSRAAMDLLMRLEGEADAAGGKVHVLLGNHEVMNLTGDLRYVAVAEYAAFAEDETADERDGWFEVYSERGPSGGAALTKEVFDEQFPPGFFAHRRAFRADGTYGQWLLSKPIIVVLNRTAFVHGGVHPDVVKVGLDGINGRLVDDLGEYVRLTALLTDAGVLVPSDNYREHTRLLENFMPPIDATPEVLNAIARVRELQDTSMADLDLPLWYRGNVGCSRIIEEHRLTAALASIGAAQVVIGHTPTASRQVLQRFDGRIVEIDTGMLNSYYQGRGNALVIEGEQLSVITESGERREAPLDHPRRVGNRPEDMSAGQVEALLSSGRITSITDEASAVPPRTTVQVTDGTHTIDAIFLKRVRRGFYPNVAAYRLDQTLGLGMVPVTVRREVDGKDGSLQFLPKKTMDEGRRSETGRGVGAWCPLPDQWQAMYMFDALIHNEGRSYNRMIYAPDRWQLILIEHQNAFATRKGIPKHLESAPIELTEGWRQALENLDADYVKQHFEDVLDKGRRRAFDARRKSLLARQQQP